MMLRREREDLERLSRDRERIAKSAADARASELRADFEQQISAIYAFDRNKTWKKAHDKAEQAVKEAQRVIADECSRLGILPEFRPQLNLGWYGRGENATKQRRDELRRAAYAHIDAMMKKAKTSIALKASEIRVRLIEGSLESDEAKKFLESMPTAAALMPTLSLQEVEKKVNGLYSNLLQ